MKSKALVKKIKEQVCEQHYQWYNEKGEIESFCCETYKDEAPFMNAGPIHIGKCLKCNDIDKLFSKFKT